MNPIRLSPQEVERLPETRRAILSLKHLKTKSIKGLMGTPENFKNKSSRDAMCILIRYKEGRMFPIDTLIAGEALAT